MVTPRASLGLFVAACALLSLGASCDRAAEPDGAIGAPAPSAAESENSTGSPGQSAPPPPARPAPCIVPLADPPPPEATPAKDCPLDPMGAPVMPRGTVTFVDAPSAPTIDVELAERPGHREHGLMYRTDLGADEGMLFTWSRPDVRSFWMHNTCLPLDMLFIAEDGTIQGILEQVPPMNDDSRSIPCRATHVLEVHAGWTRKRGVQPGQRIAIGRQR